MRRKHPVLQICVQQVLVAVQHSGLAVGKHTNPGALCNAAPSSVKIIYGFLKRTSRARRPIELAHHVWEPKNVRLVLLAETPKNQGPVIGRAIRTQQIRPACAQELNVGIVTLHELKHRQLFLDHVFGPIKVLAVFEVRSVDASNFIVGIAFRVGEVDWQVLTKHWIRHE